MAVCPELPMRRLWTREAVKAFTYTKVHSIPVPATMVVEASISFKAGHSVLSSGGPLIPQAEPKHWKVITPERILPEVVTLEVIIPELVIPEVVAQYSSVQECPQDVYRIREPGSRQPMQVKRGCTVLNGVECA